MLDLVALFASLAWLIAVVLLILHAVGQRQVLREPAPALPMPAASAPYVAVIVPVRDEAANIGRCLAALLAQDYPAERFHVLVIDDHSTDETAAIVAAWASRHAGCSLLRSPPLPPGWIGKSHACWIGARTVPAHTEWLCLLDADVTAAPGLLSSTVRTVLDEKLDLLSLVPRHDLQSFAERLVMPCGFFVLAFAQDLAALQARHGSDATATGQFMLLRREPYDALGGHAAVRGAICEDLELARLFKRSGRRVLLQSGRRLASTRMYTDWQSLRAGFAKNLVDMLGGVGATLAVALAAVLLAWAALLVPAFDAALCAQQSAIGCVSLVPALLASAAAFSLHVAGTLYFRIPFWYGFLFPLGYTAGAIVALDSIRQRLRHRVVWKGRVYS